MLPAKDCYTIFTLSIQRRDVTASLFLLRTEFVSSHAQLLFWLFNINGAAFYFELKTIDKLQPLQCCG